MNHPASPILIDGGDFYEELVEANPETSPFGRVDRLRRLDRCLHADRRWHERLCRPESRHALAERHRGRLADVYRLSGNKKVIDAFVDHFLYTFRRMKLG